MDKRDNSEGGGDDAGGKQAKDSGKSKRNIKAAVWRKKVARYLAYCVDGGLL